jgi:hypothetical protein
MACAIALSLLLILFIARRLPRRPSQRVRRDRSIPTPCDDTARGRLVALSDSIRDALADQFGTAWRAKTIEEMSTEFRLEEALGCEQLRELIHFLNQVDRLKFAPVRATDRHESLEHVLATWEPRLADLKNKIKTKHRGRIQFSTFSA